MEVDPIQTDVRRQRRTQRLGNNPVCILCGFAKPEALLRTRRSLLEKHHVLGRATDAVLTVHLCLNCHALVTEKYRTTGVSMRPGSVLDRVTAGLRGFGTFLPDAGESCFRLATALDRLKAALDRKYPEWRSMEVDDA